MALKVPGKTSLAKTRGLESCVSPVSPGLVSRWLRRVASSIWLVPANLFPNPLPTPKTTLLSGLPGLRLRVFPRAIGLQMFPVCLSLTVLVKAPRSPQHLSRNPFLKLSGEILLGGSSPSRQV